jgi:hypothetical protein
VAGDSSSAPPSSQILFSPAAGTFSSAQTVTVSSTLSACTLFCTTDGTPSDPASPQVGSTGGCAGTVSVPTSMTLSCTAVQGAVPEQNLQNSSSGWKVVISSCAGSNCTRGTPTAQAGGGVSGVPTSWTMTWGGPLSESMTGPTFTQILIPFTTEAGNTNNTAIAQHKIFSTTTPSTISQNIEIDSESLDNDPAHQVNGSTTISHNFGYQCEQASDTGHPGHWTVAGGDETGADEFFDTGITFGCPVSLTQPTEISTQGHWIIGDTGCGPTAGAGLGCMHYDSMTINGTVFPLSGVTFCSSCGFASGVLSNEASTFVSFFGSQDQLDIGATAGTINRTDSLVNVTQFTYNPAPVTASAAYVIQ